MNITRDKFLTEVIGKGWNSDLHWDDTETNYYINFSTWEGFGKLWEWVQKQNWIEDFEYNICQGDLGWYYKSTINPHRFADTVYEYLKDKS